MAWRGQELAVALGSSIESLQSPGTIGPLIFLVWQNHAENDAMPPRTDAETATLLTQIATAREALRQIRDLAVEPGGDAMAVLQAAQLIADEALREAGLRSQ